MVGPPELLSSSTRNYYLGARYADESSSDPEAAADVYDEQEDGFWYCPRPPPTPTTTIPTSSSSRASESEAEGVRATFDAQRRWLHMTIEGCLGSDEEGGDDDDEFEADFDDDVFAAPLIHDMLDSKFL